MFRLILQTEWRLLVRDRAVVTLAILFAALVVFAVIRGQSWMATQRDAAARITEEEGKKVSFLQAEMARIEAGGRPSRDGGPDPRDPHWVGQIGHRLALPPLPTVPLAIGQAELFSHEAALSTAVTAASLWDRIEIDNPLLTRFGRFDLAFVMVALLPLLLLAVSYNLLSSDREQGTLALALAQPVSMARLAWLRLFARSVIVLAFVFAIALVSLWFANVFSHGSATLLRLALWSALITAYAALWLALALLINTLRTGSAVNALILAGAWAVAVLLLPALLNLFLVTLHPPPSRVALTSALRTASREVNADPEKVL
ncbi:MAG: ABC transporter permease subunit, partial [Acidobacteriales bacterium]|nr:ABC transporter permease subunit [Terriglobales bacterium]